LSLFPSPTTPIRGTPPPVQVSPAGAEDWSSLQVVGARPFKTTIDTTRLPDGLYDLRVVPSDDAGFVFGAVPQRARRIDNTPPVATVNAPGAPAQGTVTISASTSDAGSGVAAVRFERAKAGGGSWSLIGTCR